MSHDRATANVRHTAFQAANGLANNNCYLGIEYSTQAI